MKKSEAALSSVLFTKAKDLEIDPVLFSSTVRFIIAHPKRLYEQTDVAAATRFFTGSVEQLIKFNPATMKPIFTEVDEDDYVNTALAHFEWKYGTSKFVETISRNCKNKNSPR